MEVRVVIDLAIQQQRRDFGDSDEFIQLPSYAVPANPMA